MNYFKHIICILLLLILSACGFKLRNQRNLPPQLHTVYLQSNHPYNKLTLMLKQTLTLLGINVVPEANLAPVTLKLFNTQFSHTQPVVNASDKARSYEFTYRTQFQLVQKNAKPILPPQTISMQRSLIINPNQVLYSNNEVSILKQEMEQTMINLLLYRLQSQQVKHALKKLS